LTLLSVAEELAGISDQDCWGAVGINRERRMRRPLCWPKLVTATSKWRYRHVKGAEKCRPCVEIGDGADQQNGDGPNSQYDLDLSKSKETVSWGQRTG
jgi:hypothetical protein